MWRCGQERKGKGSSRGSSAGGRENLQDTSLLLAQEGRTNGWRRFCIWVDGDLQSLAECWGREEVSEVVLQTGLGITDRADDPIAGVSTACGMSCRTVLAGNRGAMQ